MRLRLSMAFLVLLAAAATFAQPAPGMNPPARKAAMIAAYLQLTPDQIAAWKQIDTETAAKIKPLLDQVRAERQAANEKRLAMLTPEQKAKLDAMRAAAAFMRRPR